MSKFIGWLKKRPKTQRIMIAWLVIQLCYTVLASMLILLLAASFSYITGWMQIAVVIFFSVGTFPIVGLTLHIVPRLLDVIEEEGGPDE